VQQPLRRLLALVALILGGSAFAVDGYLASRNPGKPRIERAMVSDCETQAPCVSAPVEEIEAPCPFGAPACDAS